MVIFNILGALWVIIGFVIALGAHQIGILELNEDNSNVFLFIIVLVVVCLDFAYRFFISRKKF